MALKTPFYPRLAPLNQPEIWQHWSGYLSAPKYQYSVLAEYYAVRDAVAVFDTSPLFKYRISGPDAEALLSIVLTRDIRTCAVGQAQYTIWCNEKGYVLEDGVIMKLAENDYLLSAARPNLRHFKLHQGTLDVSIEDVSKRYGVLAVQGSKSLLTLQKLTPDLDALDYFGVAQTTIAGADVIVARAGFTGSKGYELWINAADALTVYDAIMAAGDDYNIIPMGEEALMLLRIEAGLLLIDVDFDSARHAWVDAQRETPIELGWQWMLRNLDQDDRQFVGRAAIEAEIANKTSRWKTIGLQLDYYDYERVHRELGIMPPKDSMLAQETHSLYDADRNYLGYATSVMYSPMLKKHIAIAKLPLDHCKRGTEVYIELVPIHKPVTVKAHVVKMPFYNKASN